MRYNPKSSTPRFDPREVKDYLKPLDGRSELVYRLAIQGMCSRCRGDTRFKAHTCELMQEYEVELGDILA